MGNSVTDFGEIGHRLWETLSPTLGKSVTDFGEICHRFREKMRHRLWGNPLLEKHAPFLVKTGSIRVKLVWFLDWLATKLKSHCFEHQACLGLDVTRNKSTSGKLEGKTAQTLMLNLFCVRYFYEMPQAQTEYT